MNLEISWLGWWTHADLVVRGVFVLLVLLSMATWTVILLKLPQFWRWEAQEADAARRLDGNDLPAVQALPDDAPTRQLLDAARRLQARRVVNAAELQERLDSAQLPIRVAQEQYLTVLATIGISAPFIGLLGTVWGIMHALQRLSGQALTLDAVAGPVGEALIATAAGLFAAIPALVAYNALLRWLRRINVCTAANARALVDLLHAGAH